MNIELKCTVAQLLRQHGRHRQSGTEMCASFRRERTGTIGQWNSNLPAMAHVLRQSLGRLRTWNFRRMFVFFNVRVLYAEYIHTHTRKVHADFVPLCYIT